MSAEIIPLHRKPAVQSHFDIRTATPEQKREEICRRIQEIADNLGIDLDAPFRPKVAKP